VGFNRITTVVAPAASADLATLSDVKTDLGITSNDENTYLKAQISRCSAAIAQYCNRTFVVETVRDDIWPDRDAYPFEIPPGIAPLQLSRWPIVSLTSVTENDTALVEDTDFSQDASKGHLIRLDALLYPKLWPTYKISVTYSAGYSTIPGDVVDALIRMVKARRDARNRDPMLKGRNIPGVIEQQWWVASPGEQGNMTPDISDLLDNYRVPLVG